MNNKRTAYSKMWFLLLLLVAFVAGCASNPDEILVVPDTVAPKVSVTSPTNTAVTVPLNRKVSVGFSEAMDPLTITTATFTVTGPGVTPVTGTVTPVGTTATFTPDINLAISTLYTATITTGVKDLAGNAMANDFVFTFTTGLSADTTKPVVISTINANNAINVPTNTKVGATFSEAMDPLTITSATFTLKQGTTMVPGTVTYSGVNAVFTPANILATNTNYTATITTGAKDLAGNTVASNYVWSWTTAAVADTTKPTVILVNPADLATNVATNSAVHATFSKSMDPLTVNTASFTLKNGTNPVAGTVEYIELSKIATFTPAANLAVNTTYTATVTTGSEDLAGNAMAVDKVWSFTTAAIIVVVPPTANILLTAASYGSFGGTAGMTNTGTLTQIHGDIGTIATGTEKVTGFHDTSGDIYTETPANIGAVNGTIYTCTVSTTGPTSAGVNAASCARATQARLDAQAAYLALVAKPVSADPGENLGGLTLAPGVYAHSSGKFLITGSDLTLDAQGDANAVFVFQTATSLEVGAAASPRSIILIGGAQAKNIFWQVGSAATINPGGGGTMAGTIIAQQGVVFSTVGSVNILTLNGRALSLIASVTMVNTVVNIPE